MTQIMQERGTQVKFIDPQHLVDEYDAVLLCTGATRPLDPTSRCPGRNLLGIHYAMDYLTQQNKRNAGDGEDKSAAIMATGKHVVIIGGGIVGTEAAKMAVGLGAKVTIIDRDLDRLRQLDDIFLSKVQTLASSRYQIEEAISHADLVIGAVLVVGAAAPKLVTRDMLHLLPQGSVLVDVAVDHGGLQAGGVEMVFGAVFQAASVGTI